MAAGRRALACASRRLGRRARRRQGKLSCASPWRAPPQGWSAARAAGIMGQPRRFFRGALGW